MNWANAVSVFLSAFLAMLVGILLELYKGNREKKKAVHDKSEREVQQIKGAMIAIAFNVESLLHIVGQNILPHHAQSHDAFKALSVASADNDRMAAFALSLSEYPALMMTCPEPHFQDLNFSGELAFLNGKDPNLVKQSGWLAGFSREIEKLIRVRNENIENANRFLLQSGGNLNFHQIHNILQLQTASANTECVVCWQLFDNFLRVESKLKEIRDSYDLTGAKGMKIVFPQPLEATMKRLKEIMDVTPYQSFLGSK
jgi:hypothetical protein